MPSAFAMFTANAMQCKLLPGEATIPIGSAVTLMEPLNMDGSGEKMLRAKLCKAGERPDAVVSVSLDLGGVGAIFVRTSPCARGLLAEDCARGDLLKVVGTSGKLGKAASGDRACFRCLFDSKAGDLVNVEHCDEKAP